MFIVQLKKFIKYMIDPLISTQRLFLGLLSMQKKFNGDKKKELKENC